MSAEKFAEDLFKSGRALKLARRFVGKVRYRLAPHREIKILSLVTRIETALENGSTETAKRRFNELAAILIAPVLGLGDQVYVEYGVRRDSARVVSQLRRELKNASHADGQPRRLPALTSRLFKPSRNSGISDIEAKFEELLDCDFPEEEQC
jgi:hypothetical protein